jgi:VanZ family protein
VSTLTRVVATLVKPWPSLGAWVALVLVGSSVPLPEGPQIDFPLAPDKIAHCLAYAVMSALAVRALWRPGQSWWLIVAAVVGVTAYGVLIEGWQLLLACRTGQVSDGIADAVGALIGGALAVGGYIEGRARRARSRKRAGHEQGQRRETH